MDTLWIPLIVGLALLECLWFSWQCGKARGTYGIDAPTISGNEMFERYFRVHQNTIEQLVVFIVGLELLQVQQLVDLEIRAVVELHRTAVRPAWRRIPG